MSLLTLVIGLLSGCSSTESVHTESKKIDGDNFNCTCKEVQETPVDQYKRYTETYECECKKIMPKNNDDFGMAGNRFR